MNVIVSVTAPCGPSPLPIHFPTPPHFLLYLLIFTFSVSYLLYLFSYFPIPSLCTRIGPLHFQAEGHRRRPNLDLVFFVLILCYMYFLVKDACLFFVVFDLDLFYGVIEIG